MQVAHRGRQDAAAFAEFAHSAPRPGVLPAYGVVYHDRPSRAEPVVEEGQGRGGGRVEVGVDRYEGEAEPFAAMEGIREPAYVENGPLRPRERGGNRGCGRSGEIAAPGGGQPLAALDGQVAPVKTAEGVE